MKFEVVKLIIQVCVTVSSCYVFIDSRFDKIELKMNSIETTLIAKKLIKVEL